MDRSKVAFLVDVDNTLLDNDRVIADLMRHLENHVGHERQQRYWVLFEQLRAELALIYFKRLDSQTQTGYREQLTEV